MLTEAILIPLIPKLKQKAKKYTKNYEDLVQDTLLKAWIYKHKFTSDVIPLKLLYCMMRHLYFDNIRKQSCKPEIFSSRYQQMPNQLSVISLNECIKLPNIDLAINNALGYSLEDMPIVNIKRSSMYKAIKDIHAMKEDYV